MQRLLLALSLTSVFSLEVPAGVIASCNNLFHFHSDLCASCFADGSGCDSLLYECQQLGGSDACFDCYIDRDYAQCAQLDADIATANANACAVWHPDLGDNCQSCFDLNDGSACQSLVAECSGMADGMPDLLCASCYDDKNYAQCAQNYITIAANACTARHPNFSDDCSVCLSGDDPDACTRLISECGETETCASCYDDKNYAQCAQLDAAAGGDSDDAAASIAACTASLTAADATLAQAAQVCPEVQLGQNGDYSVGPLNCDRIHSVYQNNQCCGTC